MTKVKIALLGFGTVARGLPFLLAENAEKIASAAQAEIEIAKVLVRTEADKEKLLADGYCYDFVTDVEAILADEEINIVVELMGRIEPAKTYIKAALEAGKHVVTANKDLIALHGAELADLAAKKQVGFYYEAAVAGGIPILRTLANALASDKVTRILGILNGTSNFMLTKMVEEGWTYDEALTEAQALGYAESDPTNDVEGIDAAYKATILTQFGFGMTIPFDKVGHKGISTITAQDVAVAQELGYAIKLIGDVRETSSGISAEVVPTLVPKSHPLFNVNGVMNAVVVDSIGLGQSMYYGAGAGQKPTAVSVMTDIIRVAKRLSEGTVGKAFNDFSRDLKLTNSEDIVNDYYFALQTSDSQQAILDVTRLLSDRGVIVSKLLQDQTADGGTRMVVMASGVSQEALESIRTAIQEKPDLTLLNAFKVLGV